MVEVNPNTQLLDEVKLLNANISGKEIKATPQQLRFIYCTATNKATTETLLANYGLKWNVYNALQAGLYEYVFYAGEQRYISLVSEITTRGMPLYISNSRLPIQGWISAKQTTNTFFNALAFPATAKVSATSFYCESYDELLVEVYMPDTTGAPTDMLIDLEWSDDNVTFYKYMQDFWGDLRWEDTGAPYTECLTVPVRAPYIRFSATSAGADASNYFTLTVKGIFTKK